jgi:AhpD family alkylhydroperoxidase
VQFHQQRLLHVVLLSVQRTNFSFQKKTGRSYYSFLINIKIPGSEVLELCFKIKRMRLTAIEQPRGIILKLFYWFSKRQYGKVLAALKVIYARSKPILFASMKILSTDNKLSLPKQTRLLIRYFTSHLNQCRFCSNAMRYEAIKAGLDRAQLKDVLQFETSERFNEKERALLSYIREVTLHKTCSDTTFQNLSHYFSDKEIVEITWVNATENYFNLMAKPMGLESDELRVKTGQQQTKQMNVA